MVCSGRKDLGYPWQSESEHKRRCLADAGKGSSLIDLQSFYRKQQLYNPRMHSYSSTSMEGSLAACTNSGEIISSSRRMVVYGER